MSEKCFLAFDLGAESGRAIVGRLDGERIALEERHRFANGPSRMNGRLYWNLPGLWEEIKTGLKKTAGRGGHGPVRLSGVGVDTWGVDFGLLDERGDLVGNPVHYRDGRTDGVMEKVFAVVPREKIGRAHV